MHSCSFWTPGVTSLLNPALSPACPPHPQPIDPYEFKYDTQDEYGNKQYRSESTTGAKQVTGSYGYVDANGVYRQVDYVADEHGFRAKIRSNEPGLEQGAVSPSNIQYVH